MIARRPFLSALGSTLALPSAARAQQIPKIGFLYPGVTAAAAVRIAALREGLRDGGYRAADKVEILARLSEGDPAKLAPLAADLVQRKVDVGGNVTGVFADFPDLGMKWIELLKEAIPTLSNVTVFRDPTTSPVQLAAVEAAGRLLKVNVQVMDVPAIAEVGRAFTVAEQNRPDAIIFLASPIFGSNPKLIADLALAHRFATASLFVDIARAGGLMAYGPDLLGTFRQLGPTVAKVLQGAKPAELPVERPTKFEMVINLKTAKALGLSLPPLLVQRADEAIE